MLNIDGIYIIYNLFETFCKFTFVAKQIKIQCTKRVCVYIVQLSRSTFKTINIMLIPQLHLDHYSCRWMFGLLDAWWWKWFPTASLMRLERNWEQHGCFSKFCQAPVTGVHFNSAGHDDTWSCTSLADAGSCAFFESNVFYYSNSTGWDSESLQENTSRETAALHWLVRVIVSAFWITPSVQKNVSRCFDHKLPYSLTYSPWNSHLRVWSLGNK